MDKIEDVLAWKRVEREVSSGTLGGDFDRSDRMDISVNAKDAEEAAKDEVWAGFRFVVISDPKEPDGLRVLDLGAGHASSSETLCGRIVTALRSQALLNESVGSGYLERNWPPALKESGAWPLSSLRQSFLNSSLTRLIDPDTVLKTKILEFVTRGDFGLASGQMPDGSFQRVWFRELLPPDEITFDAKVFLLLPTKAKILKVPVEPIPTETALPTISEPTPPEFKSEPKPSQEEELGEEGVTKTITISGSIPPELWNRFGTKILPKIRNAKELKLGLNFSAVFESKDVPYQSLITELNQLLSDLDLSGKIKVESSDSDAGGKKEDDKM